MVELLRPYEDNTNLNILCSFPIKDILLLQCYGYSKLGDFEKSIILSQKLLETQNLDLDT